MAREEAKRPNSIIIAIVLALVAGALTAAAQYGLGLVLVEGAQLDWYTVHPHNPVDRDTAVADLAVGLAIAVFLTVAINGVSAWDMARRGWLRGREKDANVVPEPKLWTAHVMTLTFIGAFVAAIVGAAAGFLVTTLDGTQVRAVQQIAGDEFLLIKTALGGVLGFGATYVVVRNIADNNSSGRLLARHPEGNMLAHLALAASKHAWATLGVVMLITAGLGVGIANLETDVDVTDVLPRGDPNTDAAVNVTEHFKSAFTQQVSIATHIDPQQCREDSERLLPNRATTVNCNNITDEVYVRAIEEMADFILDDSPDLENAITAASFYSLINWTIEGGQDAPASAFALPGRSPAEERRYQTVHEAVWGLDSTRRALIAPLAAGGDMYTNLFLVEADSQLELKEVGEQAIRSLHNYTVWANTPTEEGGSLYKVFSGNNAPTFFVDLPVGNAHASDLTEEDFKLLVPLILTFIVIALFVAFRNLKTILIAGSALVISFVWTMGLMGWADLSLSAVNVAIVPLILGVGIDYSIHIVTEFLEHKRHGMEDHEAFRIAGDRSGVALFIATLTTVVGLTMMMLSPSLLMAQLGGLSAFAMVAVFLVSMTFIPAALTVMPGTDKMGSDFVPSKFVPAVARWVTRHRVAVAVFVLLLTAATGLSSLALEKEEFGEPAKNFPEDDHFRIDHEENVRVFYGLDAGQSERKTNIIVFQGSVTDPRTHTYMDDLQLQMAQRTGNNGHLDLSTSRNLPFLIRTWLTVRGGVEGAATQTIVDQLTGQGLSDANNYPQTQAEVETLLNEVFESPLDTFASLFINYPENNIAIMTFATDTGSFETAEGGWNDVQASIDALGSVPVDASGEPLMHRPSFVGNTALNYLFITEELPWLTYLGIASTIAVILLVALVSGSVRATFAVGTLILATTVWWLGILPLADIGLAITLVLPLAFISAIGSDYAVHFAHNMNRVGDPEAVYQTVGKAVFFSAVTTVGPFILFTTTQNVAVAQTMVATSIAIAIILLATLLTIPLYYPIKDEQEAEAPVEEPEERPAPQVHVLDSKRAGEEGAEA